MRVSEHLRTAAEQTRKNPTRSLLTILGIVIGIAVMTAVLSVGDAGQKRISSELDKFGMNRVMIYADDYESFDVSSVELLESRMRGIESVAGQSFWKGEIKGGRKSVVCEVAGTCESIKEAEHKELLCGRFLNKNDERYARASAVIGEDCARELFGKADAVGEKVKVKNTAFTVVGVEKNTQQLYDAMTSYKMYVPISIFSEVFFEGIKELSFEVSDKKRIGETVDRATKLLYQSYGGTISVLDLSEQIENAEEVLRVIRLVLGAVAVMSLLVGGIGIMNIMLVTVRERKKEIGLRKALGARDSDILKQFLSEAVLYAIIGAAVGVAVGIAITIASERVIGLEAVVSGTSVVIAVGFSVLIGVGAGILPAIKAARLDPVEALRSE